ncbi:hypothetical protein CR205_06465 [Alteribacter lacisalsi]|uniref:Alpha/beta hydrolase n=1 Tax=Alteribacter lacisalsi TaxID=2045244 RepID=A0A2W0H8P1_9BACI|nr:hypothetical protein [Alteribacter lacisalsi]PYZ98234.1 hypothetical protein CR205_06465 [Alteribacter lacisalsi]
MNTGASLSSFEKIIGEPGKPGSILIGLSPKEVKKSKPVIVFVPGLTNLSSMFYTESDWYRTAREDGFQTAIVELYDTGGPAKSYWDNGAVLAWQLSQVSEYLGGKKLAVVGFSKGALDAQTALVHYGRHELVDELYAIGSPHHGSELADLAHSTKASWLANLIGMKNEGTRSLQTALMAYYRTITDNRPERESTRYYTVAGKRSGPLFSRYFAGGLFIPGDSDGVVSVRSATLPYGTMLKVGEWNHQDLTDRKNVYPVISDVLLTGRETSEDYQTAGENLGTASRIVRGGPCRKTGIESFEVEEGAASFSADWLTPDHAEGLSIIDPEGKIFKPEVTTSPDNGMFNGAWHHTFTIDDPIPGRWSIVEKRTSSNPSAYLVIININSPISTQLEFEQALEKKQFTVSGKDQAVPSSATASCTFTPCEKGKADDTDDQEQSASAFGTTVTLPDCGEGLYNTTMDIEGVTKGGSRFERTVVRTVYCDKSGRFYT